jgi:hypothetical protein
MSSLTISRHAIIDRVAWILVAMSLFAVLCVCGHAALVLFDDFSIPGAADLVFLLAQVPLLWIGVGLLRRRNAARIAFVAFLLLFGAWHLSWVPVVRGIFSAPIVPQFLLVLERPDALTAMVVFVLALFTWLAIRFSSRGVAREFTGVDV